MCATGQRVNSILTHLQQVREDLYSLAEDVYINANPHASEEVRRTSEFLIAYNGKVEEFSRVATEVESLVRQHTAPAEETTTETIEERTPRERRERIIRAMDDREPHRLDEGFTFRRPCGFSLEESLHREVNTWRKMLELVCQQLADKDAGRFAGLANTPAFTSRHGNPWLSRNPEDLRMALDVSNGLYAECNLSANDTCKLILRLIEAFGISKDDCIVFLREDRDAESPEAA